MFRPLHHCPTVIIGYEDKIDTSNLGLTPEVQAIINQHVAGLSVDNHAKAEEACNDLTTSYHKLYKCMSGFANFTNDSICVCSKNYSVPHLTQCRLIRPKLLTILKTALRHSMAQKASGSFQGSFGLHNDIVKPIKEHKKKIALSNYKVLKPKTAGKGKGKPGIKGASKGAARGSKGKKRPLR